MTTPASCSLVDWLLSQKARVKSSMMIARTMRADPSFVFAVTCGLPNRGFEFHKRRQLFIRMHDETLSVVAVRVHNPNGSPVGIDG
jgi:hypothetical protein